MLSQPRLIEDIHRAYLEAGADIIETYTFNANRLSLEEFAPAGPRLRDQQDAPSSSPAAPPTTSRAATPTSRASWPAASGRPTRRCRMGVQVDDPGSRTVTFDEMVANYYEQIDALVAGGVDILLPETGIRHPGAQGLPVRHRQVLRRPRRSPAGDGFRHHLRQAAARCSRRRSRRFTSSVSHFDMLCGRLQLRRRRRS